MLCMLLVAQKVVGMKKYQTEDGMVISNGHRAAERYNRAVTLVVGIVERGNLDWMMWEQLV